MANKWMKKLGLGMAMIMTVSQMSGMVSFAAPEDGGDEDWDDELQLIDILEEKFEEELETDPAGAETAEDIQYEDEDVLLGTTSGSFGSNVTWTLDENGVLTISGTGATNDYGSLYHYARPYPKDEVKKIIVEEGVTRIGDSAFYQCTNVTEVSLPNSLTSIGECAFQQCVNLEGIRIPDNVTNVGQYYRIA